MKNAKLVLIAAIVACFTVNMAMADGFHTQPKKTQYCSLAKACSCPELVAAILDQVDPWFLEVYKTRYTVEVICNNIRFLITGTRDQWIMFYLHYWGNEVKKTQPTFTIST